MKVIDILVRAFIIVFGTPILLVMCAMFPPLTVVVSLAFIAFIITKVVKLAWK